MAESSIMYLSINPDFLGDPDFACESFHQLVESLLEEGYGPTPEISIFPMGWNWMIFSTGNCLDYVLGALHRMGLYFRHFTYSGNCDVENWLLHFCIWEPGNSRVWDRSYYMQVKRRWRLRDIYMKLKASQLSLPLEVPV